MIALTACLIACISVLVVLQRQSQARWHEENEALRRQAAELQHENQRLSDQLASDKAAGPFSEQQLGELLRLRGEASMLRRQLKEKLSVGKDRSAQLLTEDNSTVAHQTTSHAPFQIRLVADGQADNAETINDKSKAADANAAEALYVEKTPLMDSAAIQSVKVSADGSGAPQLEILLTDQGRELFANITKENLNKRLAIVMDGDSYLAPVIKNEITGGKIQLTGTFTDEQARELAAKINEAIGTH
jgi:preprotein translocase subunit SecD